jgi:hypothetical protein
MEDSNLHELPSHVNEFLQLAYRKKVLLEEKKIVESKMKELKATVISEMAINDVETYEIRPNLEETKYVGEFGALQLKTKKEYQKLSKDSMTSFCVRFFTFLFPDKSEEEVQTLGLGQADWIWSNRSCTTVEYLDRSFPKEHKDSKKRKPEDIEEKRSKKKLASYNQMSDVESNTPKSKEDFLSMNIMNDLENME